VLELMCGRPTARRARRRAVHSQFDRPLQLHFGVQALHQFAAETGGLPAASDSAACESVLATAQKLASAAGAEVEFSKRLISNLASGSRGEVAPLCAFFGGIVGQEVMKAASGKFNPLQQWLYFDAEEVSAMRRRRMASHAHACAAKAWVRRRVQRCP
jgi:ubiquitin-activating enzyme E1